MIEYRGFFPLHIILLYFPPNSYFHFLGEELSGWGGIYVDARHVASGDQQDCSKNSVSLLMQYPPCQIIVTVVLRRSATAEAVDLST